MHRTNSNNERLQLTSIGKLLFNKNLTQTNCFSALKKKRLQNFFPVLLINECNEWSSR